MTNGTQRVKGFRIRTYHEMVQPMKTPRPSVLFVVFIAALVLDIFGCASEPTKGSSTPGSTMRGPTAAELAGSEWLLEDFGGTGVVDRIEATLMFPVDFVKEEKISGNASCNRFNGTARVAPGLIEVGPLASTRKMCPPAVMDQEAKYLKALEGAGRLVFDGPYLLLYSRAMEKPLRYSRLTRG